MKRLIACVCLGIFLTTLCVQTYAKAHSFDLASNFTHIHLSDTDHHHNHHEDSDSTIHEHTNPTEHNIVLVPSYDLIAKSQIIQNIDCHVLSVSLPTIDIGSTMGAFEDVIIHNNSPPDNTPKLAYFSLAPPHLS